MKVLFGILIGALIFKLLRRARWRFRRGHHGWGCRGPLRRLWWVARELDLDPRQKDDLGALWLSVRRTIGEAQVARWRAMTDLADAAVAEPLDAARLEELATRHADAQARLSREVTAAVTRLHEVLRPEQRGRLRELVERAGLWRFSRGAAAAPGDGPYR
jgi:Spy/CpxP family protein refolding chaperone